MKNDLGLSKKLWDDFVSSQVDAKDEFEINVRVLTRAQWPIKNQDEVKFDPIFSERIIKFTQFYKKK